MKRILMAALVVFLFPAVGFAGSLEFPGKDADGTTAYRLYVFKDHIAIFGADGTTSNLPLQAPIVDGCYTQCGTGQGVCFALTGATFDPHDTAKKNAWLAVLLKASATGQPASIHWSDTDEHGQLYAVGSFSCGRGYIFAVEFE
jgi:hypothetical protein